MNEKKPRSVSRTRLRFPEDHLQVIDDPDGDCSGDFDVCSVCEVTRKDHDDDDHSFQE